MRAPIAWLLDTNVVSEMMRPRPERRVERFLDRIAGQGIGLASITVWEIFNGIGRIEPGRRREDVAHRFEGVLDRLFQDRVFDWTAADARVCARIVEAKRRLGEPLDGHLPDAMLAGTANRHGLTVVTRNQRDFRNTGVVTVNPWTDAHP
ncbi:MAG: PIN domain-containing protein [Acidobacteriota bacterium]|nr:PIN domain-containing protein [Acidobacteriota bacterium]